MRADERYFRVDVDPCEVSAGALTAMERRILDSWRWFTRDELAGWPEAIYPVDLFDLLTATETAHA